MGGVTVRPSGPHSAQLVICGEAPGGQEELEGVGFVGASGHMLWGELAQHGIRREDVHILNAAWQRWDPFPTGRKGAYVLKSWSQDVDEDLAKCTEARVVMAVGAAALTRLTGRSGIGDWRGSIIRQEDIPEVLLWHSSKRDIVSHPRPPLPSGCLVLPLLHPAGILRDPSRSEWGVFRRDVARVASALQGRLAQCTRRLHLEPSIEELDAAFAGSRYIYFDTEFNPQSGVVYLIGVSPNDEDVYSLPWREPYVAWVGRIMADARVEKWAHNAVADQRALAMAGVLIRGPVKCTMLQQYCLHPRLEVGLSPTSRYHLDDVQHRKWMDKDDPDYNGWDVYYGGQSRRYQLMELRERPVDITPEVEVRFKLMPVCRQLEERGMLVDRRVQHELRQGEQAAIDKLSGGVQDAVAPLLDVQARKVLATLEKHAHNLAKWQHMYDHECPKHTSGWRHKKVTKCPVCHELYHQDDVVTARLKIAEIKAEVAICKKWLKHWQTPFNPNSAKQLQWLLYDPAAFHLPLQRDYKSKNPTSGKQAIERLSKSAKVMRRPEAWAVVKAIKEIQEHEKAIGTFLDIPLDDEGYAHPPYKIHGTTTGRLASGEDKDGELDKVAGEGSFNAFNIPEEWRHMYVAPRGMVFVCADWKNQEGRCAAVLSQDMAYLKMFEEELKGGPDVHSQTAYTLWGIDPADAERVKVTWGGRQVVARKGSKAARHGWSYNVMAPAMLMAHGGLPLSEALRIDDVMTAAHATYASYKYRIVREVCGEYEVALGARGPYAKMVTKGRGWDANPFGWMLDFNGWGEVKTDPRTGEKVAWPVQANEVLANRNQSSGASMWARCGVELGEAKEWPGLMPVYGSTGYDSFTLAVPDTPRDMDMARGLLVRVMEQPWKQLGGYSFPVDIKVGYNLGPASNDNAHGLRGWEEVAA